MTRDSIVQKTLRHRPPPFLSIILAPMNIFFPFIEAPVRKISVLLSLQYLPRAVPVLLSFLLIFFSKITYSGLRMMSSQVCDGRCRDCGVETGALGQDRFVTPTTIGSGATRIFSPIEYLGIQINIDLYQISDTNSLMVVSDNDPKDIPRKEKKYFPNNLNLQITNVSTKRIIAFNELASNKLV